MTRWPTDALLAQPGIDRRAICGALNLSGGEWLRLLDVGLNDRQADRAAIRLGHHPANVWPGWIDAALGPLDHDYLATGWRQAWLHQEAAA